MYDDDARSASPSAYEKKDLGFVSSFHKEFDSIPQRSNETSPFSSFDIKTDKSKSSERDTKNASNGSPAVSPRRSSKIESRSRARRSRSRSRDKKTAHKSLSRSPGRRQRAKSPVREKRRSRSRDHHYDRNR